MRGVGRSVATLVVAVDDEVKTHELVKGRRVVSKHAVEARRVVKVARRVLVDLAVLEGAAVDKGGNLGQLGNDVEHILERVLPVRVLVDALGVGGGKLALRLAGRQGQGQLSHGVHGLGQGADQGLDVLGQGAARSQLSRKRARLLHRGDLARQKEPDERLGQGLALASRASKCWELGLQLRNAVTAKPNALLRIQQRGLVVHALDIAPTSNALVHSHLTKRQVSVILLELLHSLLLGRNLRLEDFFQSRRVADRGRLRNLASTLAYLNGAARYSLHEHHLGKSR